MVAKHLYSLFIYMRITFYFLFFIIILLWSQMDQQQKHKQELLQKEHHQQQEQRNLYRHQWLQRKLLWLWHEEQQGAATAGATGVAVASSTVLRTTEVDAGPGTW
jgi:hypothetical protein